MRPPCSARSPWPYIPSESPLFLLPLQISWEDSRAVRENFLDGCPLMSPCFVSTADHHPMNPRVESERVYDWVNLGEGKGRKAPEVA